MESGGLAAGNEAGQFEEDNVCDTGCSIGPFQNHAAGPTSDKESTEKEVSLESVKVPELLLDRPEITSNDLIDEENVLLHSKSPEKELSPQNDENKLPFSDYQDRELPSKPGLPLDDVISQEKSASYIESPEEEVSQQSGESKQFCANQDQPSKSLLIPQDRSEPAADCAGRTLEQSSSQTASAGKEIPPEAEDGKLLFDNHTADKRMGSLKLSGEKFASIFDSASQVFDSPIWSRTPP